LGEKYLSKKPVSNQEIIRELCHLNKPIIVEDILTHPRVENRKELNEEGIRIILDIPVILREELVGLIRIYFKDPTEFSDEELNFVGAVAEQCACAIDKARMIEEQKSQYDQLALQTEKLSALGRMAAGIAHEINNPLAGILLFSTNMRKKVAEEGPFTEGLEVIIRETQRCKGIIQDLLEFSRDREPKKALANINQVIEKALNILENEFRLHRIAVDRDLSKDLPDTFLDVNLMQQVFVNLFMNAVEAIQENGSITVRSYADSKKKVEKIEIRDTGSGIPPENVAKIFEPFFSTKSNGTGLGLAVSYGILQKHDGKFHVSSQPGQGTRFTLEIPIIEAP
jgi:signal transduction histidine kinase